MKKKYLNCKPLLSLVSVFDSVEFKNKLSISVFDFTQFYKWVLHNATTDVVKGVVEIITERVPRKVGISTLEEAQSSEQNISNSEKTFLECARTQHKRLIIHSASSVEKFSVTDPRILKCFRIAFNTLNNSIYFPNGESHLQMILGAYSISVKKNSAISTCRMTRPTTFECMYHYLSFPMSCPGTNKTYRYYSNGSMKGSSRKWYKHWYWRAKVDEGLVLVIEEMWLQETHRRNMYLFLMKEKDSITAWEAGCNMVLLPFNKGRLFNQIRMFSSPLRIWISRRECDQTRNNEPKDIKRGPFYRPYLICC